MLPGYLDAPVSNIHITVAMQSHLISSDAQHPGAAFATVARILTEDIAQHPHKARCETTIYP